MDIINKINNLLSEYSARDHYNTEYQQIKNQLLISISGKKFSSKTLFHFRKKSDGVFKDNRNFIK